MKRTPRFVREKKARGAAPKLHLQSGGSDPQDQVPAVQSVPETMPSSSSPSWSAVAPPTQQAFDVMNFMAKFLPVVDSLWKAELRWSKADPSEQGGSLKHLGRNLQAGLDALHSAGFEIKDHTNERYVEGSRVEVLAFQPVPGIANPTVIETLKPTVYFMDRLLRRGQIIVGKPIEPNSPNTP